MDIATIVLIVLNVIFGLCLILGFLWGLKRGLKKSLTRMAFIAGCLLVAFFVALPVTNALLTMDISSIVSYTDDDGNQLKSIEEIITNAVCSISTDIEDAYNASASLRALIDSLPKMIMQCFIFVILFWLLKIITWPIFAILAKCLWGKKKKSKEEKKQEKQETRTVANGKVIENGNVTPPEPKPEKKHRWWGSLVGVVQGFMIAFFTMLPLAGVASIVGTLTKEQPTASASSESSNEEPETLSEMLTDAMGQEVIDALTAYDKSFLGVICGVTGVDDLAFDLQSSAKIGNNTTTLRKEIITISNAYNEFQKIQSFDLATLDFDTLQKLVDSLFNSPALTNIADELVPYYVNKILDDPNSNIDKDLKAFLVLYVDTYNTPKMIELKNDIDSIINAMKIIQEKDIFALKELNVDNLIAILEDDGENTPIKDIFTALTGSTTIQKVLQTAVNFGLDMLGEELTKVNESKITIEHAKFKNIDWKEIDEEIPTILNNLIDLYKEYDIQGNTQAKIDNVNFVNIGRTLDIFKSSTLLEEAYQNSLTALNQVQKYAKFVNFNALKTDLNFTNEFTHIQNIVDGLITVDAMCFITEQNIDLDVFLTRIGEKVTNDETCIDVLVNNLVDCNILKSSAPRSLNVLYEEQILPILNPPLQSIDKIDENNINWNDEKSALKTILNFMSKNAPYFLDAIDAESILRNVDLENFGVSLDSMKNSKLLYPLYKGLIEYAKLDESIKKYINVEKITLDTNWTQELANLKLAFDEIKASGLIDALFASDGINQALSIIKNDQTIMRTIIDHAFDSVIVQSSIQILVNTLQGFIADALSVEIQDTTIDIDNFKNNIESKKTEFSNIINNIAVVASPIMQDNFDLDVFANNLTDFANAFEALQASVEFKNTYNGILTYLINNEQINAVVDFSVVGDNFDYTGEFETIGEIITILKNKNVWTPIVDGTQSVDEVVDSLDADTKSQVVDLILESKLFSGYAVQALNQMIDEFNGYLNSSVAHIPEGTDLSSQSDNIALVTKKLLELTDGGMSSVVLNEIDLNKMAELLNALQVNKFELNGALSGIYDAFVDYMVDDADYGYLIADACNSFGTSVPKNNADVNWTTICDAFGDLLALESSLNDLTNLNATSITTVLNNIGTNENTLVVRIVKTYLKNGATTEKQTAIDNFDFTDTTFNSQAIEIVYKLKDLGTEFGNDLDSALTDLKTTLNELDALDRTKLDNLIVFVDAVTNSSYAEMIEGTDFGNEADLVDEFKSLLNYSGDITIEVLTQSIQAFNNSNLILNELYNNNIVIFNIKDTSNLNALKQSIANGTGVPANLISDDDVYQAITEIVQETVTTAKQVKVLAILNL